MVCREPHRVYAWQPLSGDAAIEPADNVIRIESHPEPVTHELNHDQQRAPEENHERTDPE